MDAPKKRSASQANLAFANRPAKRRQAHRRTPTVTPKPYSLNLLSLGVNSHLIKLYNDSVEYLSKVMTPDMTPDMPSVEIEEPTDTDIPGGFPLEGESPLINGMHAKDDVEEVDGIGEDPIEDQREPSEVPTQAQDSPDASPPPESRADSVALSIARETTFEPTLASGRSTPASTSPRKGSHRKPVLYQGFKHRAHPLKKQHDFEQKMRQMRELYSLKRASGYSQDEKTFRTYMSYREHIEAFYAATDKKLPPPLAAYGQDSIPPLPSSTYLHRAFQNARRTLESPRPVIPNFNTSDAIARRIKERDEEIERRLRPKLPDSLAPEDEQKVQKSVSNRSFLAKVAREQVTHQDLSRLKPGAWLNDEIINFYGALISERAARFEDEKEKGKGKQNMVNGKGKERINGRDYPSDDGVGDPWKIHVFNTYFLAKLQELGYEKAKLNKWTKKVDIFSKDLVLIPCNLGNSHWTCAAINFRQKRIEYYDSMGMDRPGIRQALRTYLDKEHRDKKSAPFDYEGWTDFFAADNPQQENGYDCGVFVCQAMENLSRGVPVPFDFTQRNMPYLRRRMILEIANECLPRQRL